MSSTFRSEYRSLFWPLILIGVGIVWLMSTMGIIGGANIAVLFRLWPLLLIAIGLDLLLGRRAPLLGALIGLGTLGLAIVLMLIGPGLGLAGNYEVETAAFSEPVGDARSAEVTLNLSVGRATVTALNDSTALIDADLTYVGEVEFQAEGETDKTIRLGLREGFNGFNFTGPFDFFGWLGSEDELHWDIGLSPDVDLRLAINGGVGEANLDLSGLQLTALDANIGVGKINLILPAASGYTAQVDGGVGEVDITIEEGASLTLDINSGVGGVSIDVPDGAAVRLEADPGLGGVETPGWLALVSGDDDDGVWETEGFSRADSRITITFDGGIGGLTIR